MIQAYYSDEERLFDGSLRSASAHSLIYSMVLFWPIGLALNGQTARVSIPCTSPGHLVRLLVVPEHPERRM